MCDEIGKSIEADRQRYRERGVVEPMQGTVGTGGPAYGAVAVPLRERALKQSDELNQRAHRIGQFALRLTPEIEETISVLREGIQLGFISLDSSLTRY